MNLNQTTTLFILIGILLLLLAGIENYDSISISNSIYSTPKQVTTNQKNINSSNLYIICQITSNINSRRIINQSIQIINSLFNNLPNSVQTSLKINLQTKLNYKHLEFKDINQQLERINTDTFTLGINQLNESLLTAKKKLQAKPNDKQLLIITDSLNQEVDQLAQTINRLKDKKITTYTVQTGQINRLTQAKLQTLARTGGGRYFTYFEQPQLINLVGL